MRYANHFTHSPVLALVLPKNPEMVLQTQNLEDPKASVIPRATPQALARGRQESRSWAPTPGVPHILP